MLLSQDEARFPMVPTLSRTLGVKGHRPHVGTQDCKDLLYVFAVVNLVTAALHSTTLESPKDAKHKTGQSKTARMQEAFAAHLRHVGRVYPRDKHPRVVLLIDNAPWHTGRALEGGLGGQSAPGVEAAAELQPDAQPDRAVLEGIAASGDTQSAVRHLGGPEAERSQQPELLPNRAGSDQDIDREVLHRPEMRQHQRACV